MEMHLRSLGFPHLHSGNLFLTTEKKKIYLTKLLTIEVGDQAFSSPKLFLVISPVLPRSNG